MKWRRFSRVFFEKGEIGGGRPCRKKGGGEVFLDLGMVSFGLVSVFSPYRRKVGRFCRVLINTVSLRESILL